MIYTNPIYLLKTGCHLKKETNYRKYPYKNRGYLRKNTYFCAQQPIKKTPLCQK